MHKPTLPLVLCALGALPLTALATGTARQEYQEALRATPDLERGARHYATCASCHGANGDGVSDGTVPAIAGQHFRVVVRQLVDFRHDRRWDIRMEHFADRHHLDGAQAVADVAAYVSTLERAKPASYGDGESVRHGASVYFGRCAGCHGASGQGSAERLVPRLAGQHYQYLMRQLYDAVDGRRPNMGGDHARLLRPLERRDIVGVSDYLSRMIPAAPVPARAAAGEGPAER